MFHSITVRLNHWCISTKLTTLNLSCRSLSKLRSFLTWAVGIWEDWRIAEVVLQGQVSHTVETPIGGKAQTQCVTCSEDRHKPWGAAVSTARAAVRVDRGRVGQKELYCSLKKRARDTMMRAHFRFCRFEKKTLSSTNRAVGGVVRDGERCREISFNAGWISFLYLKSNSLNATWKEGNITNKDLITKPNKCCNA